MTTIILFMILIEINFFVKYLLKLLDHHFWRRGHRSRFPEDLPEQQGKSKFRFVAYIRLLPKVKAKFVVVHL